MRVWCVLAATVSVLLALNVADGAPISSQPVHTSKSRFRIPFKYDPTEMQKLGAREIRLYLSTDRGLSWQLGQTVDPRERKFDFVAPGDGEYWFAVRTLDARGQLHPPGPSIEPGLKVTVDSAPPELQISLRQLEPGKVELSWSASDPHLDPTTLRLEYVQTGASNWQTVSIIPQAAGRTWWSAPQGGYVAVRGSISDRSNNTEHAQAQTTIAPAGQAIPRPSVPDFREPIAVDGPSELAARFPEPLSDAQRTGPATPGGSAVPVYRPINDNAVSRPEILQGRYPKQDERAGSESAVRRLVNSRQFQIGYQVDDVGPSGIASVDLYITEDGGRQWYKYGQDADAKTPFPVQVPREGVYGFALRVLSGAGLAADPPSPGEKPSIIIVVDETPAELELLPIQQGGSPSRLTIRWKMSDANPGQKPVSVHYAAGPDGPWELIADELDNSGSFMWAPGPDVPSRLYLRLTARDAAGNAATAVTRDAVLLDLSRPTARILDVEAAAGSQLHQ